MKHTTQIRILVCALLALPRLVSADTFFTNAAPTADAFLAASNPTLNYGGAGTLAIAPADSTKGEFDSIVKFNVASAVSLFNTTYGAGNWQITGLTLQLASSFPTQGQQPTSTLFNTINAGSFAIQWLSIDNWVEGTGSGNGTPATVGNGFVSFNSIGSLMSGTHDSLGDFTYTPPGNTGYLSYTLPLNSDLVGDVAAGGDVSLYFSAADTQVGYLFNSRSFGANTPEFIIEAGEVPEPGTMALLAISLGGLLMARRAKIK